MPRASTRLFRSGSSVHVTIPKPLREFLQWDPGVELMITVGDDQRVLLETLEQYIQTRETAARDAARRELVGARA